MKEKVKLLISREDKKNPITDEEIANKLNVRRETVTLLRNEVNIPDSRERRKAILTKEIKKILSAEGNISERLLTERIQKQGFDISRHAIREYKKEVQNIFFRNKQSNCIVNEDSTLKNADSKYIDKNEWEETDLNPFSNLIGAEGSLKPYIQLAEAAMLYPPHGLHTLILGGTGVGKSELAFSMYECAKHVGLINTKAPLITFNCADYSDNPQLLMAQLFGYVKGSFTGAEIDKEGLVEKANKSILFLDEVHRLPPEGQELLFYLIDKGKFRRLGETNAERLVQVTIIAATTENAESTLLATFRRRIPVTIELPPLSVRPLKERLEIVKNFFTKEANRTQCTIRITNDALRALLLYECLGNIGQLRSDVQVSCARGFLNKVVNKKDIIQISFNELPSSAKRGLLKIMSSRAEIEKLAGDKDLIIYPDSEEDNHLIDNSLYVFPNEIYSYIEERYNDLQNQHIEYEAINEIIGNEMEGKFKELILKVENNIRPVSKKDLIKIVGIDIIKVVEKIIRIAENKLDINADKLYYLLAIHLSTTFERVLQGKIIKNPHLDKIKSEYKAEFSVAKEMLTIIQIELNVQLSDDEAGFITMYLRMMANENEEIQEGNVGVIIISHGSVASSMADVANGLLSVSHAKAVEMSLDESPNAALKRTFEMVKRIDEGKGVLLLVDMGSLVTFGEIITNKTGIKTRSLSRVDTLMAIEAVRRAISPNSDLDEIADTLEENPKYITRLNANDMVENEKPNVIITICITGQGSALRIKELIENIVNENERNIKIIPIGALDDKIEITINKIREKNNIVSMIGTINPNIAEIPFISLEEIVDGVGILKLKNQLIKYDVLKKYKSEVTVKYSLKELVKPNLTFLNIDIESKSEILKKLSNLLVKEGYVKTKFLNAVMEREKMGSTYYNNGFSLPHGEPSYVIKPAIVIAKLNNPIDWDGKSVSIVIMLALFSDCIDAVNEIYNLLNSRDNRDKLYKVNNFDNLKYILEANKGGKY